MWARLLLQATAASTSQNRVPNTRELGRSCSQEASTPSVAGSIFLDPDGTFPNHTPNPEDKKAVEATTQAVLQAQADLGLMFDTDVDRSGIVDKTGKGEAWFVRSASRLSEPKQLEQ